jgi:hypothetical protein
MSQNPGNPAFAEGVLVFMEGQHVLFHVPFQE